MKSETTIQSVETETEREPTNAYEVLMPRPRSSKSPKKHESPRPPPEDEIQKKIAKENRASNKKNLEVMSLNKIKKNTNSRLSLVDKNVTKSRIVILPSESEEELSDLEFLENNMPNKGKVNVPRRKIMSDSESDAHDSPKKTCAITDSQLYQSKLNFKPQSSSEKEEDDSKKRNSLLNYFNTVSREEAKKTSEQIKVKVHIHSPPTTPGHKPINKKSPAIDTPRRSARMRLNYEPCDLIEVISSELVAAPKTPVKISVKKPEAPKIETPKRSAIKTPVKSPLKIKEKPEYVKNLKLKIRAPVKSSVASGTPGDKFILSPEALDELFLSPNPNSKVDKEQKKQKKKKKVPSVPSNNADSRKSPRKVTTTPRKSPKKIDAIESEVFTRKSTKNTPKKSPRAKAAAAELTTKSSSKRSPNKPATSVPTVTPKKNIVTTPKKSPRAKSVSSSTLSSKSSKKSHTKGSKTLTPKKTLKVIPKNSPRSKTAVSALKPYSSPKKSPKKTESKREKSSGSDARPTSNKSSAGKSLKIMKEIPLVKIQSSPKSTKSAKSVSKINKEASSTEKSAFEEIMSKKKTNVPTGKGKGSSANSVSKSHKDKGSSSSTHSKRELSKSTESKVSISTSSRTSEKQQEIIDRSSSKATRKSTRIPSSESRRTTYEEDSNESINQLPKKRKRKIASDDSDDDDDDVVLIELKVKRHQSESAKPQAKLAPMFMKRTSGKLSEKVVGPVMNEAKRLFLSSGVPECIKKIAEIHSQPENEVVIFPSIAHVKQEDELPAWTVSAKHLELLPEHDIIFNERIPKMALGTLTDQKLTVVPELRKPNLPSQIQSYRRVLDNLKLENPNYCVIRNYKRLKSKYVKALPQPVAEKVVKVPAKRPKRAKKRKQLDVEIIEEPEVVVVQEPCLVWTEKYKPMSSEDVVGNVNEVNQLKAWLESWKRFHKSEDPNYDIIKRKRSKSGSSDEFIEDDESREEDNSQMPVNTSMIFGPCGSGKTSAVYAIAHELGFKVLEMNASSKRTGKHLLKLQEATQSHRICPKNEVTESIATMFAKSAKQKKKKAVVTIAPKPADSSDAGDKMSLILIENADILFEEEGEGFIAALVTLVQSSKRPVVMVANDSCCPHLSRFIEQSLVIEMDWPYPSHLSAWLQLVSLVEGVRISSDAAQRLVGRFNGDVARCLNQLQFWTMTGGNNLEARADDLPASSKDDESSNSTPIAERVDEGTPLHDKCIELFLGNTSNSLIPSPIRLTEVWWNLAPVLSLPQPKSRRIAVEPYVKPRNPTELVNEMFSELESTVEEENIFDLLKRRNRTADTGEICDEEIVKRTEKQIVTEKWVSVCSQDEVDSLAMLMDNMAWADEFTSNPTINGGVYDVGPCPRVWERSPVDGISARHDYRQCLHQEQSIAQSMAHYLVDRSVGICREKLGTSGGDYNVALPKQEDIRWRLEQQEADNTIVRLVPANVLLDHRATFTDYLPMLQSVCRHENARLSTNTKRRNRFFHYLRGLGCHPTEEAVNVLCSTFDAGLWRCEDRVG